MTFYLVNIASLLLMMGIVWWFWMSNPKAREHQGTEMIDVIVESGTYDPAVIKSAPGILKLRFIRKDAAPCAERVIFDKLDISSELPLNKPHLIELPLQKPGEYEFTCQMGMYRGKIIITH